MNLDKFGANDDNEIRAAAPGLKSNFPTWMRDLNCVLPYDKRSFDCTQSPKKKVGR